MSRELSPADFVTARPLDEVGQRLLAAAQVIRERGWCQRTMFARDGRVCAVGAINTVARANGYNGPDWLAVTRLRKQIGGDEIWHWNDRSTTTAEMVIEALERAAFCHD